MFNVKSIYSMLICTAFVAGLNSCTKKWDDHDAVPDSNLNIDLKQAIAGSTELSDFNAMLVKTGYDTLLASSKTYTVWAPTNAALASLDPLIAGDINKLKLFVGNHIASLSYPVSSTSQRIKMLNDKYNTVAGTKIDDATITKSNIYTKNGVYHVIDKFVPRLDNNWEVMNNNTGFALNKAFFQSQNYDFFDSSKAEQTGVDPITGAPIYKPGTGLVKRNYFLNGYTVNNFTIFPAVLDVSDESNQYTLFLLTDAAYTTEFNKLKPWFTDTLSPVASNFYTGQYLVRDLAVKGLYTPATLPDSIPTQFGVKIPVNKAAIVASYKTSNGYVYVMNSMNFTKENKFPPIIIEGEKPTSFSADRGSTTFYRVRKDSLGQTFNDILITNTGVAGFYVRYRVPIMHSMRYNASWRVVNDWQTATWQQRLVIDVPTAVTFPYVTVPLLRYAEVLLGQFTLTNYGPKNFYLTGPAGASTTSGAQIALDYIKLTPAF